MCEIRSKCSKGGSSPTLEREKRAADTGGGQNMRFLDRQKNSTIRNSRI